ncbi:Transcriptional regulatory protein, C terminal [Nonomuraea maritima]|uniref:Transcriptional regulatory protein, C terminal n=1 Tax=Nonomuraea maritima TaxID=683260 RepID=A0A1G9S3M6_9ACTN|nr:BTAD domain-containing putative transcriptional regulator [Nonomuraea maritima]SDM29345.1 Transcriptional regulatory protein, C terminal [Nonomuraea maritima]
MAHERALRIKVLGPLRVWQDGVELDTGPRQQAFLFALLLAHAGRPVSTNQLIDLIWEDDVPASALNIVQKYVGALRRLLEPSLPARESGAYLQRRGNGYLFVAESETLDLVQFRRRVRAAGAAVAERRPADALACYVDALGLWRGSAAEGWNHGAAAMSTFVALDHEFFDACTAAAELAVSLGQAERVLPPLRLAASLAPLHEPVQAALVSVLAAAGHQAEALSAYLGVRARLVEELGIDPGEALRAAHQRVLGAGVPPPRAAADPIDAGQPALVGRVEELAVVWQAVESALSGRTGLVLVEGEPGVGKTRLVEEVTDAAHGQGAHVVWGNCLEDAGAPSMWPWVRSVGAVLDALAPASREKWLTGELGYLVESDDRAPAEPEQADAGGRFRLFELVAALLREVSAVRPVVLVIDDLQWADVASLQLFGHLAVRLPSGVAIIGTFRDRAPTLGTELSRLLAVTSRVSGHRRIRLGPLGPAGVAELVRREAGRDLGDGVVRGIHARTAGNPFFVRELSRLLAAGGDISGDAAVPSTVPSTVRDVVRDRVSHLDDEAHDLLQAAALIGRDVDLGLLARVAGLDTQACLDRLEPVDHLGLLGPTPGNPFSLRFAHDLVRESVATAMSPHRMIRLHLRVADALEATGSSVESVARHLWAAGPLADPSRTARALIGASRRAVAKSALEAAEQHLRSATRVARSAGLAELELSALSQLTAVIGMGSGYVGQATDLLERAEHLARELGREEEAVNFLLSRQAAYCQGMQLDRAERLARQFLDQTEASADPVLRAYGLHAWAIYQWAIGEIGSAFDYQRRSDRTLLEDIAGYSEFPLRRDLHLIAAGMHAEISALHGDLDAARPVLDTLEAAGSDPYAITVWASFASVIAALADDPAWALRVTERGIAEDPGFSFAFFGAHLRVIRCWARAVTGLDPATAAAEAEALLTEMLPGPPLTGRATWYGLISEMWLAAGRPDAAAVALDHAERVVETYGERYAEGLLFLLRARLLMAGGARVEVVRAAAERARTLSAERGAHLFTRRAEHLMRELGMRRPIGPEHLVEP